MRPVWLLVVAVAAVGLTRGAASQCLEHPSCQEVTSESSMLECIQLCRSDLVAETPSDVHFQPVAPSDPESLPPLHLLSSSSSSSSSPQAKRSYSMDHFRWGKPVGRKRSPFKVFSTKGDVGEEASISEARAGLAGEKMPPEDKVQEVAEEEEEEPLPGDVHEKKDGTYKMKHFRWSGPPASKRYGGFMKSWDERSQRPLFTLLKNVINKDGQEQKREQ